MVIRPVYTLSLYLSPSHSLCVSLCIVLWALFTSHFPSLASMSFCRNVIQICVNRLSSGFTCLMPHASCLMTQAACPVRGRGCLFSSCCPPRLLCAIVKLLWLVGNLGRTQDTGTKQTRHRAGHRLPQSHLPNYLLRRNLVINLPLNNMQAIPNI